ncbi:DUF4124 domain-containing protein [Zoogloea sp.]|jgi:hypothetical protein|uniref:DUF4124 domain-containing protein n=1 Tax=Zoogloea sp. TaxID=49181 RepID=UPI0035AF4AB6
MKQSGVRGRLGALAAVLAAVAMPASAVNKCVAADGSVTYTDGPCAGGSTQAKRIETPPPLSYREQLEARRRSERVVDDARALEARQTAEWEARQRRQEAERAAELAAQQRQARQETLREEQERWAVTQPVIRRYVPPIQVVPPRPIVKPPEPERPQPVRPYPFR